MQQAPMERTLLDRHGKLEVANAPQGIVVDISGWLKAASLEDRENMVLRWCQEKGVETCFQLASYVGELALLLGVKSENPLETTSEAIRAFEIMLIDKLAMRSCSDTEFSQFGRRLADSLGLQQEDTMRLWTQAEYLVAASHAKQMMGLSDDAPVDFYTALATAFHVAPEETPAFWHLIDDAFAAARSVGANASSPEEPSPLQSKRKTASHLEDKRVHSQNIDRDEDQYNSGHGSDFASSRDEDASHLLPASFADVGGRKPGRADAFNRRGDTCVRAQRIRERVSRERLCHLPGVTSTPSSLSRRKPPATCHSTSDDPRPSLLDSPERRRARPNWDTSWEDDRMKHSSKQKFFDAIHRHPRSEVSFETASPIARPRRSSSDPYLYMLSRSRKRREWDSSWQDDSHLHSSKQKFFDPVHNKSQYSMMHFRKSSPQSSREQQWWGAGQKWWNLDSAEASSACGSEWTSPSARSSPSSPSLPRSPSSSPNLPLVHSKVEYRAHSRGKPDTIARTTVKELESRGLIHSNSAENRELTHSNFPSASSRPTISRERNSRAWAVSSPLRQSKIAPPLEKHRNQASRCSMDASTMDDAQSCASLSLSSISDGSDGESLSVVEHAALEADMDFDAQIGALRVRKSNLIYSPQAHESRFS